MSAISRFLFGDRDRMTQQPTMTGGQTDLLQNMIQQLQGGGIYGQGQGAFGSGMDYLQDLYGGGQEGFNKLAAPYLRQFEEQTVPGLAERFSGAGAGGRSSSAFNQAMGQAGGRLSESLGSMFEGLKSQNLGNLMGMAGMPFQQAQGAMGQRQFENVYQPGSTGFLGQAGGGLAGGLGQAGGMAGLLGLLRQFGLMG